VTNLESVLHCLLHADNLNNFHKLPVVIAYLLLIRYVTLSLFYSVA